MEELNEDKEALRKQRIRDWIFLTSAFLIIFGGVKIGLHYFLT